MDKQSAPIPVEPLRPDRPDAFRRFCRTYRARLDDSYLTDDELDDSYGSDARPGWVVPRPGADGGPETLRAAAALIMDDYHRRGRRARFAILFDEADDPAVYRALLDRALPAAAAAGADRAHVFVKDGEAGQRACLEAEGFRHERSSCILVREDQPVGPVVLPGGCRIRPFVRGRDEPHYAAIRNAAFRTLAGSATPLTVEDVSRMLDEKGDLVAGIFLLEVEGTPVGLVVGARDSGEGEEGPALEIGPLALLPEHQGRGLGGLLLRYAVRFGREEAGLPRTILSVNAENERALGLYLREGFTVASSLACLRKDLG